ncbi:hypothetical protein ACFE04_021373 [Oxalis oulophora]
MVVANKLPPVCGYLLFILLITTVYYSLYHPHHYNNLTDHQTKSQNMFLALSSNNTISSYLNSLTKHPHLAGTKPSLETTQFVQTHFQNLNFETHRVSYQTLLSYPVNTLVSVGFLNGTVLDLSLDEKGMFDFDVVRPYHAYSPSGSVNAKVVYVNYGREEDYVKLSLIGVYNVSGCLVIVKKSDFLSRGNVVKIAESKGAVGVLLFAKRDDFQFGIERGTVMRGIGDPLSPGWGAVEGAERLSMDDSEVLKKFPKIPSLPLSLANAYVILGSLGGPVVPKEWGDDDENGDSMATRWRVGPGHTLVNLTYQGENKVANIHNVFAIIRGSEEPDRFVLLGNHRDAWTYGAVDPNSGTAALLDIARRYALMMRKGWNPRRTVILCSWDAEEFGMIGSTEWVENNLINLRAKAVSYLNVDCAVQGPGFFAGATPQLDDLILEVIKKIKDPDSEGKTLHDKWQASGKSPNIVRLSGVDSDFAPFLHHAGVPAVDLYYGQDFPVYHTAFDSYNWITTHADPLFHRHVAIAGVWGLLGLRLADDLILPFNYRAYAAQLREYEDSLRNLLAGTISLDPLTKSIQELDFAAKEAGNEAEKIREQESRDGSPVFRMRGLNDRLMLAERGFLDADGLEERKWFKHLIYGPSGDSDSKLTFFPGISDAISRSSRMSRKDGQADIQHEVWRVARAIKRAASALQGEVF